MADFLKIIAPPNRSTQDALLIPDSDGTFTVDLIAVADHNGQGTPSIWAEIQVDGQVLDTSPHIAWENGPGGRVELIDALPVEKGKVYKVRGVSGNANANAKSIELSINRVL